jgi:MORN repeat
VSKKPVPDFYTYSVLKIQSAWKSFIAQKQYTLIKKLVRTNHNYFTVEEIRYSLSCSKKAISRHKVEKFSYPSGAVYKGEWLGGFRDGNGVMDWPDGASYQGAWSYGYPYGYGTFSHVDGDTYSGEWKNPYSGARLEYSGTLKSLEEISEKTKDGYGTL